MRKWILALLLITSFVIPDRVLAQTKPILSSLVVDLWPEYDRPSMLVIYHITLSPDAPLPLQMVFTIPTAAGNPNAVAVGSREDSLGDISYNRQVNGDWARIIFNVTMPVVRLEYYDVGLIRQGTARHFEYQWPGDYDVSSMAIVVQQPIGASKMILSPASAKSSRGVDGLTYFTTTAGSLDKGQKFKIALDYQKSSDALSAENLTVEPSAPLPETPAGHITLSEALPWILAVIGVVLIAGGGWWFWQSGRHEERLPHRRRHPSNQPSFAAGVSGQSQTGSPSRIPDQANQNRIGSGPQTDIYCHQCGNRAAPGDRFCRSCGTRLRTE